MRVVGVAKNGVVVRAEGIEDRSAAEALRGTRLYVRARRCRRPPRMSSITPT